MKYTLLLAAALTSCPTKVETTAPAPERDLFSVITYNVAGIPQAFTSEHHPSYTPQIGGLLSTYDIVLVQEDFGYHQVLAEQFEGFHQSIPKRGYEHGRSRGMGDGLSRFSKFPFGDVSRYAWDDCQGVFGYFFDCHTSKGTSRATHTINGFDVDIYNLHMDAGVSGYDVQVREKQVAQLIDIVKEESGDRPVIITGDFNMQDPRIMGNLKEPLGLTDVCDVHYCVHSRIDRMLFRGPLVPVKYHEPDNFTNSIGEPLTDHQPIVVYFRIDQNVTE